MTGAAATADETPAGIAAWLRKAADLVLGKAAPVAKVQTFASMVAGQELQEALGESWWTLQDALWSAIYATDDNGADLTLEAKQALVGQDLDEFKAYLLAEMNEATSVAKRATPAELGQRQIAAVVAKAGKKISGDRLGRLQTAAEALNGVLAEVAEIKDEEAQAAEEATVEKAELVAAFTEATAPLVERIDKIEKSVAAVVAKPGNEAEEPATLEGIAEAVSKIADRVGALESTKGVRKSADGQEGGTETVKKSVFAGIL